MKQTVISAIAVLGAAALLVGAFLLWRQRPWRVAASVNGRILTAAELDLRARSDLEDSKRLGRLMFPPSKEDEAFAHFRREHAKFWILKEVILSEAVARNTGVGPDDEKREYDRLARRLKDFNMTLDDYLKKGLLPEERKRQDVRETILMRNFTDGVILPKIRLDAAAVDEHLRKMQMRSLVAAKQGEGAKEPPSRRAAMDSLREERYREEYRRLFRELFVKAEVRCPEYPELEQLDKISPPRPEDDAAKR